MATAEQFNRLAGLSLLLCVATVGLWVWSYGRFFEGGHAFLNPWDIQVFDGHIRFLWDGTFQRGENSVPLWLFAIVSSVAPLFWLWWRFPTNRRPR